MATILGIDVSSYRLDAALIRPGVPFEVQRSILGKAETGKHKRPAIDQLIDRARNVYLAIWDFTGEMPDWVVIEDAYGPSGRARKALDLVTGAIIACAPHETQVKLLKASQWRSYLGAKNTKASGHAAVWAYLTEVGYNGETGEDYPLRWQDKFADLDEHEIDALGVALGWAAHLESQSKEDH